jgi:hypothetical protein
MTGNSDNNRSERQGGFREELSSKEVRSKDTTVGTRTDSEAVMRAISVLGNAKSNSHQKTHRVESGGTGRKFMHLTRGGLRGESRAEVSRDHSSEDTGRKTGRAKGRRTSRRRSTDRLRKARRGVVRNEQGHATAASSLLGGRRASRWISVSGQPAGGKWRERTEGGAR